MAGAEVYKIKKERKAITPNPAQIVGSLEHAATKARENLTGLVVGIVLAVVIAVAVAGYFWMRQQQDRAAEDLLHQGMRTFAERPVGQQQTEFQKAIEVFRKVAAEYPRTAAAPQAVYMLGNALSELHDWEGAARAYQDFLSRYGDRQILAPLVYQRLGYAYLAQGKVDEAEKTFSTILKLEGAPNRDHALYELAQLIELTRPKEALARYQDLIKQFPQSPYAQEAAVRVKTLEARESATPPAPPTGQQPSPEQK